MIVVFGSRWFWLVDERLIASWRVSPNRFWHLIAIILAESVRRRREYILVLFWSLTPMDQSTRHFFIYGLQGQSRDMLVRLTMSLIGRSQFILTQLSNHLFLSFIEVLQICFNYWILIWTWLFIGTFTIDLLTVTLSVFIYIILIWSGFERWYFWFSILLLFCRRVTSSDIAHCGLLTWELNLLPCSCGRFLLFSLNNTLVQWTWWFRRNPRILLVIVVLGRVCHLLRPLSS